MILKKLRWIMLATVALGLLLAVTPPALATVVVNSDNTVTFTLEAPNISTKVELTYSSEATITVPMTNVGNIWSVTIGPLTPNWYRYWFNVDGMRMHDPLNADHYYSIYGRLWSYFLVPGPEADFLATKAVPHGMVATVWYFSSVTNSWRSMAVYTPPGYNHDNRKYPVLYLHHGAGNTGFEWIWNNRGDFILDNLFAAGKAVPMIVVMPTHHGLPTNSDPALDIYPVQELLGNIVPVIEKQFRVLPGSKNRAFAGLSMGGGRTLQGLLQVPGSFDYFCPLSMGWSPATIATLEQNHRDLLLALAANKNIELLWISVGTLDPLVSNVQATLALFDKYRIEYIYAPFPDGRHEPDVWRHNLYDFAQLLFREHGRR
jgi:enterochelin esterase-like enzyme